MKAYLPQKPIGNYWIQTLQQLLRHKIHILQNARSPIVPEEYATYVTMKHDFIETFKCTDLTGRI